MLKRFGMLLLTFAFGFVFTLPVYLGVYYLFGMAEIDGYHVNWHEAVHDVCLGVICLMLVSAVNRRLFGRKAADQSGKSSA